ncbi:MAG: hypothetical protein JKY65_23810 [Planctomycetes bacterium]|nr:hypothetical protein [Planctomycetota bacterium]
MPVSLPTSIEGVAHVEVLHGADAKPGTAPTLLVEVPHGADEQRHYDALAARLRGDLPVDLDHFFQVNTDVGAWAYGRATAEAVLEAEPGRSALLVRSLIPRTFIDCNRPAAFAGEDLTKGGVTAGTPPYVEDEQDLSLLRELHASYVELARAAFVAVCGAGGFALVPHTYAPRTVGISSVGRDIVEQLHAVYAPDRHEEWPLRAEVDLLTREQDGTLLAPPGIEEALLEAFARAGFSPVANDTFYLHPATLGHGWSAAHPGRVTCLEIRRDLVVERWRPFEEKRLCPKRIASVVGVLAPALVRLLSGQTTPPRAEHS